MITKNFLKYFFQPILFVLGVFHCLVVSAESKELDTVQVTPNSSSSTFSTHDFIGSHKSLGLEGFVATFYDFGEILNQQSGIDIQSVSGIGQFSTPIIRGAEGHQVLVFNNGIALNSSNSGGADIGSISLIGAQSVDIYRGMIPMELSSTAIGGAINIITRDPTTNDGSAGFALGSYGVNNLFLSQQYSKDKFNININIDSLIADNDFIYKEEKPVFSPSAPKNQPRYNNGSKSLNASGKLNYRPSNKHLFSTYLNIESSERELSAIINTPNNQTNINKNLTLIQFSHQYDVDLSSRIETTYSLNDSSEIFDDREGTIGLGIQHNQYDTVFQKFNTTYKKHFNDYRIVLNQQIQQERLNSYFLNNPTSSADACTDNTQCDGEFVRLYYSSGIRLEWQASESLFSNFQFVHINNQDNAFSNETSKKNNTYSSIISGVSYRLDNGIILEINSSKQVRPPSTNELYGDRGTTVGNPELTAEKSLAFETGFNYLTQSYTISLYGFYRKVKDNISAQQDNRGVIKYSNIAKTSYKGVEISFTNSISQTIFYSSNVTYQKGIINNHQLTSLNGNEVGDHRSLFLNQSFTYTPSFGTLNLEHTLEKGGYDDDQNLSPRKQKSHLNMSLSTTLRDISISFQVKNLSNQRVRDYPHSPVEGRTFFFKLRHK